MLKGIPPILSPELLSVLDEMGHGDRICIGDGNFPGASYAAEGGAKLIRADGHGVCALLDAILQVMPLDAYVDTPAMIMEVDPKDAGLQIPIWDEFKKIIARHDERGAAAVGSYERFAFYGEAKRSYCVLQTGETEIYANIILQKGVVKAERDDKEKGTVYG
ncbi:MAG: fucose isomerase [Oscillospiraceae bacterium]|nr:fucose isomerase [Oscillospiraceae bacterium]